MIASAAKNIAHPNMVNLSNPWHDADVPEQGECHLRQEIP
jgi:hypothetical protein